MNIGPYTFEEFKQLASNFHGYAAPGLLLGGFMVELAKSRIPEGTLFEAVVESRKCLPDAVQLLTLCSVGNNWMKIHNLGRYAVSLFDKFTGEGVRVSVDADKLDAWPEIRNWLLKLTPKTEQDEHRLLAELEQAGDTLCRVESVTMKRRFLGHAHMGQVGICPLCREPYPVDDGTICRGCQGDAPYVTANRIVRETSISDTQGEHPEGVRVVPVAEAVGKTIAHDMTRIEPGVFKGPEFVAGQRITVGDICRLQQMGRFHVAVTDESTSITGETVHENEAAEHFARRMAGDGVRYDLPPHEGKIDFIADRDGLFRSDVRRLYAFNLVPDVMVAARQDATLVRAGEKLAGTRAIPLYLHRDTLQQALDALGTDEENPTPLFQILPLRHPKVGILVTGTEVFQGIIEDKFIPVITAKTRQFNGTVVKSVIVPDDENHIARAVAEILAAGADLLVTTGGLSVDPDDVTRKALINAGLCNVLHGAPVLPGTMSLVGALKTPTSTVQVLGVPACALYYKTTFLDLMLPQLLAGCEITRGEVARIGDGGFCLSCKTCTYPKCAYGK